MKQRPVVVQFTDGTELWFPSLSDGARGIGCARETLRRIINRKVFKGNRQNITGAWWSD